MDDRDAVHDGFIYAVFIGHLAKFSPYETNELLYSPALNSPPVNPETASLAAARNDAAMSAENRGVIFFPEARSYLILPA
jgi:hypothetical protein